MKKKLTVIIAIILIILAIIFVKNKVNNSKIRYELQEVEKYAYFKYRENDNYGVIDREGNIVIKASYIDIQIPNLNQNIFLIKTKRDKYTYLDFYSNKKF